MAGLFFNEPLSGLDGPDFDVITTSLSPVHSWNMPSLLAGSATMSVDDWKISSWKAKDPPAVPVNADCWFQAGDQGIFSEVFSFIFFSFYNFQTQFTSIDLLGLGNAIADNWTTCLYP